MAKVKPPYHVDKLTQALRVRLGQAGIHAKVGSQPIAATKLYRIIILAPEFKAMPHSDRQSLVWRIAESALPVDKQLLISSILTLDPGEAGVATKSKKKKTTRSRKTA
jgi:hypothetical protein